jgi:DNA polymerase-4
MRKIIHIDMDAFYAAVEERDDPSLAGKPIAVGGGAARGVVMTANYVARAFGVRSAMPGAQAARRCPDLVFVRPRFAAYKAVSRDIRAIFGRYTDLVEPLSLDEAYLDVTEPEMGAVSATSIARAIKDTIRAETGLTASAGVAANKFLAKLASDMEKPDGLCIIRPADARRVLAGLPLGKFHGVGPATARRLQAAGITTGADLQALTELEAVERLGRQGAHFWRLAQGIDDRRVEPRRDRKSLSVETTFDRDLSDLAALDEAVAALATELAERLTRAAFRATTVTLKIKTHDFRLTTRQTTLAEAPDQPVVLAEAGRFLLRRGPIEAPVRLLGLGVGGAPSHSRQLPLPLEDPAETGRLSSVSARPKPQ